MNGASAPKETKRTTHYRYQKHLIMVCLLAPPTGTKLDPCIHWRRSTVNPDRCMFLYPDSSPGNCLGVCDYCIEFGKNVDSWNEHKEPEKEISPMKYMWGKSYKRKDYPK